jgi:hypothetical protein
LQLTAQQRARRAVVCRCDEHCNAMHGTAYEAEMNGMSDIRIGISGWRYVPWRGDFYPEKLTQKNELKFASRAVNSIEINGSFYSLKTPALYAGWFADVP